MSLLTANGEKKLSNLTDSEIQEVRMKELWSPRDLIIKSVFTPLPHCRAYGLMEEQYI